MIVAVAVAVGGLHAPAAAHPDRGFEIVICAEGATRTITVDENGNPLAPLEPETCAATCRCCLITVTNGPIPPDARLEPTDYGSDTVVLPRPAEQRPASALHLPEARGPPPEESA